MVIVFVSLTDSRHLPDFLVLVVVLGAQAAAAWYFARGASETARKRWKVAWIGSALILVLGFLVRSSRVARFFPAWAPGWGRGLVVIWAFLSVLLAAALFLSRWLAQVVSNRLDPRHDPVRRGFLRLAQAALFAAPVAATGYGVFVQRFQLRLREQDVTIPGLGRDLDGLRLVQLTDIHLSPFLSEQELARAIAMANETRAHIALVTGDLITSPQDPLDACIQQLSGLKADAGIFGCMGNHEIYSEVEDYTERRAAALGMRFLRRQAALLRFGSARLNLAGVDYARSKRRYLVGAERLVEPGALNVLLSHNPDVFPVAAKKGFDFTIAGHTHGGQVRVEILRQDLNVARFFTPYVDGLYTEGKSAIFVSRGIGTIGMPVRLGAPPEVALIRLCRS